MALITLPFTVTGQQLEFAQPVLAEHAVGSIGAAFSFSTEWATLTTRTATFATFGASYDVALVSDACTVPSEVLTASSFRVSVRGSDGTHVLTTTIARIGVKDSLIGGDTPAAPTPSVYDQLVAQATAAESTNANAIATETTNRQNALKNVNYMNRAEENMVVFSDSTFQTNPDINDSNPDTRTQKSVISWMQEMCPNMTLTNYGVGGTDLAWLQKRLTALAASTEESAKIRAATYVVIAYGTNDWQESEEPLKVNKISGDTTDVRYDDVLTRLQQMAPNANILCVTPAFLKSTSSSYDNILNVNKTGNTLYTYNDIMEWVAKKHNVACLRLDQIMGINMSNYQHRMVASTEDIWVHYNQQTNKRIAITILAWMYGACVPSATTKCMDVTPYSWLSGRNNVRYFNVGSLNKISTNQFNVTDLLPNHEYWLTFLGGNIRAYVNNKIASNSLNLQGVVQFPIQSDPNGNISLKFVGATESDYSLSVYNMRLTDGRPNIWDALRNNMYATNNYGEKKFSFGDTLIIGHMNITEATPDSLNKIADIPYGSSYKNGTVLGTMTCTINSKKSIYPFTGRVYNGGIYWNVPEGWTLTGTIDAQVYYLILAY